MFNQLARFRFWYERGDRKARLLKTNYENCSFLDTRPTQRKRDRDNLSRWIQGAKPRGLLHSGKAEKRRLRYAKIKFSDSIRYQVLLTQMRARSRRYLMKKNSPQ